MKFLWLYPNAKINLGLKIVSKREDGFHEIDGYFMPIDWFDVIEVGVDFERNNDMQLICSGLDLPGAPDDNLLFKCYDSLKAKCGDLPALKVHLHKNIPIGAGLGGGSADAAFFVKGLIEACELELSDEDVHELLLSIGSDCPFFINNKMARVTGIGDEIHVLPNEINFIHKYLLLVYPGIHVSSQEAYGGCVPTGIAYDGYELSGDLKTLSGLENDFEKTVGLVHPEIMDIKETMIERGAAHASMSGSGSTVYGFFDELPELNFPDNYIIKLIKL